MQYFFMTTLNKSSNSGGIDGFGSFPVEVNLGLGIVGLGETPDNI
jgi:hypothetical protein